MTKIENAVEYLKAKRQADGSFLYFADEVGEYYRVSQSDLDKLEEMQDYSLWCASYGESTSGRYNVCRMREGRGSDVIGDLIISTDDAQEAKRYAEKHGMDYYYGTIIHDTETGMVDSGEGWEEVDDVAEEVW